MIRIWARTINNDKITRTFIYESIDNLSEQNFRLHIEKICHKLDIPTPLILKNHYDNFEEFNSANFASKDFVESVDFDKFIIENAIIHK